MPKSSGARFSEKWQQSVGDEGFLEGIVDRWRSAAASDGSQHTAMFAESVNLGTPQSDSASGAERRSQPRDAAAEPPARREVGSLRRDQSTSEQQTDNSLRAVRERLQQR